MLDVYANMEVSTKRRTLWHTERNWALRNEKRNRSTADNVKFI